MRKFFYIITLLLTLTLGACSQADNEATKACEAAEKGDVTHALEYADKAYADFDKLDTEALCRLAASYAVVTLTTGDQQAADRFQQCYKASINSDSIKAEKVYNELDPQMAEGLAIISGLLEGRHNFEAPDATDQPSRDDSIEVAQDALRQAAIIED